MASTETRCVVVIKQVEDCLLSRMKQMAHSAAGGVGFGAGMCDFLVHSYASDGCQQELLLAADLFGLSSRELCIIYHDFSWVL